MSDDAFRRELATHIESLIATYHRLATGDSVAGRFADCCLILEELSLMEMIYPELVTANSPTNTLQVLMEHLGEGALHSRYPMLSALTPQQSAQVVLGTGAGIYISASSAIFDIYYVDGVLVKMHLRDGAWSDILAYHTVLEIPATLDQPRHLWATLAFVVESYDETASTLCAQGRTLELLERLFPRDVESGKLGRSETEYQLTVVDTSHREEVASAQRRFQTVAAWLKLDAYYIPYHGIEDLNEALFGPTASPLASDYMALFFHTNDGHSAISLPGRARPIHAVVTDLLPRMSIQGHVDYTLVFDPRIAGRTTLLPSWTRSYSQAMRGSPGYSVGDVIEFDGLYGWAPPVILVPAAGSKHTSREICPFCNTRTVVNRIYRFVMCPNQKCPGTVAARLQEFSEIQHGAGLPPFTQFATALRAVQSIQATDGPCSFPELLMRMPKHFAAGMWFPEWGRDCENAGLHEILEFTVDSIAGEYTSKPCWRLTWKVLTAMGLFHLTPLTCNEVVTAAMARMAPPFPYITHLLADARELVNQNIPIETAPMLAAEVRRRWDEFLVLNQLFSADTPIPPFPAKAALHLVTEQADAEAKTGLTADAIAARRAQADEAVVSPQVLREVDAGSIDRPSVTTGLTVEEVIGASTNLAAATGDEITITKA